MYLATDLFNLLNSKQKKPDLVVGASFFEIYSGKVCRFYFIIVLFYNYLIPVKCSLFSVIVMFIIGFCSASLLPMVISG